MTKRAGKNRRSPARFGGEPKPVQGELIATGNDAKPGDSIPPAPEYTFVGPGKDVALVRKAIEDGWDVPFHTRRRLIKKLTLEAETSEMSRRDLIELVNLTLRIDKLNLESAKVGMVAYMNGLDAGAVGVVEESHDSPDELFDKQLANCKTPEEVETLLRVTQSI